MNAGQRNIFLILTVAAFGSIIFFKVHSTPGRGAPGSSQRKTPAMRPEPQRQAQLERPLMSGVKAKGTVSPFALVKDGLEASIRSHPMPEVWLAIPPYPQSDELFGVEQDDVASRVQLPRKVMRRLTDVWKVARYYYYLELFGPQDPESRFRRANVFTDFLHNTSVEIHSATIKTPAGERPLSWDEANSLVNLVNDFAKDLLLQADETVRPKRRVI